ncbi:hypothetical protein [Streptomyces sp. SID12501]|uniref:Uncharacterized protein n=1 Tax=Streptomyces sp. SID12501 TaxID=2706042 RepID=A0A6B3BVP3_9ACTN|nr:hypothetical protein [Streptomyces sp. SID12501]NEC88306.1 hypothetical protein [Streptomyces sp. SID12501]
MSSAPRTCFAKLLTKASADRAKVTDIEYASTVSKQLCSYAGSASGVRGPR